MKNYYVKYQNIINPLLVSLTVLLIYLKTAGFDFVWDDMAFLLKSPYFNGDFSNLFKSVIPGYANSHIYSPLVFSLYFIFYKIFGSNPLPYHLLNITYYLLTTLLIYSFFLKLTKKRIAFLAALFFAATPLHVEPVCWISGNGYLLGLLFLMLSFNVFIDYMKKDREKTRNHLLLVYLFAAAAYLSQPFTAVLPVLFIIYAFIFCKQHLSKAFHAAIPLMIFSPMILLLNYITTVSTRLIEAGPLLFSSKIAILGKNLANLFVPVDYSPLYPEAPLYIFTPLQIILAIILLIILALLFFTLNNKFYRFFILWACASLFLYSNIFFNLKHPSSDRYLYLPSVASSLLIGYLAYSLFFKIKKPVFRIMICVGTATLLAFYIFTAINYSEVWKNSYNLWTYTYKKNPASSLVNTNLAQVYSSRGEKEKALRHYLLAIDNGTDKINAYVGAADTLISLDRKDEAEKYFIKAYILFPQDKITSKRLISFYFMQGNYKKAKEISLVEIEKSKTEPEKLLMLKKSLFILNYMLGDTADFVKSASFMLENPNLPENIKKGLAFHNKGQYGAAAKHYNLFLAHSPDPAPDIQRLQHVALLQEKYKEKSSRILQTSLAEFQRTEPLFTKGEYDAAQKELQYIVNRDPYFYEALLRLAEANVRLNQLETAILYYEKAKKLNPSDKNTESVLESCKKKVSN